MAKKQIAQGAEAKVYLDDNLIKERFPKSYRLKEIDDRIRSSRTRREAKVLTKLEEIDFPSPRLIKSDDKSSIVMENIKGKMIKEILDEKNFREIANKIGSNIAALHNFGIIHGDLTTSNMIFKNKFYLIDFGLSFFSEKAEDKAVDLHLLKEALESKHHKISDGCFKLVLHVYKNNAKNSDQILKRLEAVEKRGRYRAKKGG